MIKFHLTKLLAIVALGAMVATQQSKADVKPQSYPTTFGVPYNMYVHKDDLIHVNLVPGFSSRHFPPNSRVTVDVDAKEEKYGFKLYKESELANHHRKVAGQYILEMVPKITPGKPATAEVPAVDGKPAVPAQPATPEKIELFRTAKTDASTCFPPTLSHDLAINICKNDLYVGTLKTNPHRYDTTAFIPLKSLFMQAQMSEQDYNTKIHDKDVCKYVFALGDYTHDSTGPLAKDRTLIAKNDFLYVVCGFFAVTGQVDTSSIIVLKVRRDTVEMTAHLSYGNDHKRFYTVLTGQGYEEINLKGIKADDTKDLEIEFFSETDESSTTGASYSSDIQQKSMLIFYNQKKKQSPFWIASLFPTTKSGTPNKYGFMATEAIAYGSGTDSMTKIATLPEQEFTIIDVDYIKQNKLLVISGFYHATAMPELKKRTNNFVSGIVIPVDWTRDNNIALDQTKATPFEIDLPLKAGAAQTISEGGIKISLRISSTQVDIVIVSTEFAAVAQMDYSFSGTKYGFKPPRYTHILPVNCANHSGAKIEKIIPLFSSGKLTEYYFTYTVDKTSPFLAFVTHSSDYFKCSKEGGMKYPIVKTIGGVTLIIGFENNMFSFFDSSINSSVEFLGSSLGTKTSITYNVAGESNLVDALTETHSIKLLDGITDSPTCMVNSEYHYFPKSPVKIDVSQCVGAMGVFSATVDGTDIKIESEYGPKEFKVKITMDSGFTQSQAILVSLEHVLVKATKATTNQLILYKIGPTKHVSGTVEATKVQENNIDASVPLISDKEVIREAKQFGDKGLVIMTVDDTRTIRLYLRAVSGAGHQFAAKEISEFRECYYENSFSTINPKHSYESDKNAIFVVCKKQDKYNIYAIYLSYHQGNTDLNRLDISLGIPNRPEMIPYYDSNYNIGILFTKQYQNNWYSFTMNPSNAITIYQQPNMQVPIDERYTMCVTGNYIIAYTMFSHKLVAYPRADSSAVNLGSHFSIPLEELGYKEGIEKLRCYQKDMVAIKAKGNIEKNLALIRLNQPYDARTRVVSVGKLPGTEKGWEFYTKDTYALLAVSDSASSTLTVHKVDHKDYINGVHYILNQADVDKLDPKKISKVEIKLQNGENKEKYMIAPFKLIAHDFISDVAVSPSTAGIVYQVKANEEYLFEAAITEEGPVMNAKGTSNEEIEIISRKTAATSIQFNEIGDVNKQPINFLVGAGRYILTGFNNGGKSGLPKNILIRNPHLGMVKGQNDMLEHNMKGQGPIMTEYKTFLPTYKPDEAIIAFIDEGTSSTLKNDDSLIVYKTAGTNSSIAKKVIFNKKISEMKVFGKFYEVEDCTASDFHATVLMPLKDHIAIVQSVHHTHGEKANEIRFLMLADKGASIEHWTSTETIVDVEKGEHERQFSVFAINGHTFVVWSQDRTQLTEVTEKKEPVINCLVFSKNGQLLFRKTLHAAGTESFIDTFQSDDLSINCKALSETEYKFRCVLKFVGVSSMIVDFEVDLTTTSEKWDSSTHKGTISNDPKKKIEQYTHALHAPVWILGTNNDMVVSHFSATSSETGMIPRSKSEFVDASKCPDTVFIYNIDKVYPTSILACGEISGHTNPAGGTTTSGARVAPLEYDGNIYLFSTKNTADWKPTTVTPSTGLQQQLRGPYEIGSTKISHLKFKVKKDGADLSKISIEFIGFNGDLTKAKKLTLDKLATYSAKPITPQNDSSTPTSGISALWWVVIIVCIIIVIAIIVGAVVLVMMNKGESSGTTTSYRRESDIDTQDEDLNAVL